MTSLKFIASQAKSINRYKNLRTKLAKCCANIYFNKQCLIKKVIPKYGQINVPNTTPASTQYCQEYTNGMNKRWDKIFVQEKRTVEPRTIQMPHTSCKRMGPHLAYYSHFYQRLS